LASKGQQSLIDARKQNPSFRRVKIVLPQLTFDESYLILRVGKKTLSLFPLPGPCSDNIGVLVEEDRVLFAGDAFMALPYIVDGDIDDTIASLKKISKMGLENVVPGHGDIVLRGEIDGVVKDNLAYLSALRKAVRKSARRKYAQEILSEIGVEDCGKSRVLIGGLAEELHRRNLRALYFQMYGEMPKINQNEDEILDEDEDNE
jgi:glyoxylase-like metal-dependent hydrolase (beta-lactamase superfamily II)